MIWYCCRLFSILSMPFSSHVHCEPCNCKLELSVCLAYLQYALECERCTLYNIHKTHNISNVHVSMPIEWFQLWRWIRSGYAMRLGSARLDSARIVRNTIEQLEQSHWFLIWTIKKEQRFDHQSATKNTENDKWKQNFVKRTEQSTWKQDVEMRASFIWVMFFLSRSFLFLF